jgi:hypothetical protein
MLRAGRGERLLSNSRSGRLRSRVRSNLGPRADSLHHEPPLSGLQWQQENAYAYLRLHCYQRRRPALWCG